jgi:hypothetical protein
VRRSGLVGWSINTASYDSPVTSNLRTTSCKTGALVSRHEQVLADEGKVLLIHTGDPLGRYLCLLLKALPVSIAWKPGQFPLYMREAACLKEARCSYAESPSSHLGQERYREHVCVHSFSSTSVGAKREAHHTFYRGSMHHHGWNSCCHGCSVAASERTASAKQAPRQCGRTHTHLRTEYSAHNGRG